MQSNHRQLFEDLSKSDEACEALICKIDIMLKEIDEHCYRLMKINTSNLLQKEKDILRTEHLEKQTKEFLSKNNQDVVFYQKQFSEREPVIKTNKLQVSEMVIDLESLNEEINHFISSREKNEVRYSPNVINQNLAEIANSGDEISASSNKYTEKGNEFKASMKILQIALSECDKIHIELKEIFNYTMKYYFELQQLQKKFIEMERIIDIGNDKSHRFYSFVTGEETPILQEILNNKNKLTEFRERDEYNHDALFYAVRCGLPQLVIFLMIIDRFDESEVNDAMTLSLKLYKWTSVNSYSEIHEILKSNLQDKYSNYETLWSNPTVVSRNHTLTLNKRVAIIFEDYYSPIIIQKYLPLTNSWLSRILSMHWNRSNKELAEQIRNYFINMPLSNQNNFSVIAQSFKDFLNQPYHKGGSFERRVQYVSSKLGLLNVSFTNDIQANINNIELSAINNNSTFFKVTSKGEKDVNPKVTPIKNNNT
jgi:hypothetical protein